MVVLTSLLARHTSLFTLLTLSPPTFPSQNSKSSTPNRICKSANTSPSLGAIDASTVAKVVKEVTEEEKQRQAALAARPPVENILNLHDFEVIAKAVIPPNAWAYYSSASDDEITIRENRLAYQRVWFRPRILRDVSTVDWSTTILGCKSSLPLYIVSVSRDPGMFL